MILVARGGPWARHSEDPICLRMGAGLFAALLVALCMALLAPSVAKATGEAPGIEAVEANVGEPASDSLAEAEEGGAQLIQRAAPQGRLRTRPSKSRLCPLRTMPPPRGWSLRMAWRSRSSGTPTREPRATSTQTASSGAFACTWRVTTTLTSMANAT